MAGMPLSLGPEDRTSSGPRTAVPAGPGVPEDAARSAAELRSILERASVAYCVRDARTLLGAASGSLTGERKGREAGSRERAPPDPATQRVGGARASQPARGAHLAPLHSSGDAVSP